MELAKMIHFIDGFNAHSDLRDIIGKQSGVPGLVVAHDSILGES